MSSSSFFEELASVAIQAAGDALMEKVSPGYTYRQTVETAKAPVLTHEQEMFESFMALHGSKPLSECSKELKVLINELRERSFKEGSERMREHCIDVFREHYG